MQRPWIHLIFSVSPAKEGIFVRDTVFQKTSALLSKATRVQVSRKFSFQKNIGIICSEVRKEKREKPRQSAGLRKVVVLKLWLVF